MVPTNSIISDERNLDSYKKYTFTGYNRNEIINSYSNFIKDENLSKIIYISSEMVSSNLLETWCFKTIIIMSSFINLSNPELPTYLHSRINDLYKIIDEYKYNFETLRNVQEVRNIVSEVSSVLCLSKKKILPKKTVTLFRQKAVLHRPG